MPFSRRRFCRLLALAPVAAGAARAAAPPETTPLTDAVRAFTQGCRLVTQGRSLEKAIRLLTLATQSDPQSSASFLALGCALASRAASLAYAATFAYSLARERAHFGDTLRDWENSREEMRADDPASFSDADYDKTRPTLPPPRDFPTKDDDVPFRLTRAQTEARLTELCRASLAAWASGRALSRTPAETAQAHYITGWGIRLLRRYLIQGDEGKALFVVSAPPPEGDVLAAFGKATDAAPDNPLYWQARGDALPPGKEADAAYEKALTLHPRNPANLWYRLYQRAAADASAKPVKDWPAALEYLRKARAKDTGNAWPLYEEAGILFRFAPYSLTGPSENRDASPQEKEAHRAAVRNDTARQNGRRAIDRIVEGNAAPRCAAPRYLSSIPGLLAVPWGYTDVFDTDFTGYARVRELARAAGGYGQFMAEFEHNGDEAERAGWAAISMGKRLCGDWPVEDNPRIGALILNTLVGMAVTAISYKLLGKSYEILGETEKAAALQAESDAFKSATDAYKKALLQHLPTSDAAPY